MTTGINKMNVCVEEVVDKETGKKYIVHAYIDAVNPEEKYYADFYISDDDPSHKLLVGFGGADVSPERIKKLKANQEKVSSAFSESLAKGIKRFEAVMAQGMQGNELRG